ncbi:hypothetical protein [Desulfofustis glycolicus]|uniref:TIGR04255 family protein n=1 Tax=Desulfofustis glycolicus DSM 9705 TaxID=1121409 RepID=A0A1M5YV78_9BACT|nr:hypothetical protein [Desulfofustis glycolicus]SHI15977.1 hypothetical protein SAMN02745124_04491 [Desulfofustis glycolicus DSM 9705]
MRDHIKQYKSIVLIGKFNPVIFQPYWFSANKLIGEQDGSKADIKIIHQDVVNFGLDWCNIEITRDRYVINTTLDYAIEMIRDLTIGTFQLLVHTPIKMLGVNTELHFDLKSEHIWHKFGHNLTPKTPYWNSLINPGMLSVSVRGDRPDDYIGKINVDAKGSKETKFGVSVRVNDHYETQESETSGCQQILDILISDWANSEQRANDIIRGVLVTATN